MVKAPAVAPAAQGSVDVCSNPLVDTSNSGDASDESAAAFDTEPSEVPTPLVSEDVGLTDISKEYTAKMKIFHSYVTELKCVRLSESNKNTLLGFISSLEQIHMNFIHGIIQNQSENQTKNEEIIRLQREIIELKNAALKSEQENHEKIEQKDDIILNLQNESANNENITPQHVAVSDRDDENPWVEVASKKKVKSEKPVSYSDIIRKNPFDLKIPKITKGQDKPIEDSSHIIILEGEEKHQQLNQNDFFEKKAQVKKLVDVKSKNIKINNIAPTKTGGILISCPSKDDLEKTKTILDKSTGALKLTPKYPKKKLPKIAITNIETAIPDNQIKNVILEQNDALREKLENSNEVFDLVFAQKNREFTKKAIFTCSPAVRSFILKQEFLYIGYSKCICSDHLFIHQCLHCTGFGHTEKFCLRKSSVKVTCTYCSENHRVTDCPHKNDSNKKCCSNCSNSLNPVIRKEAVSHSSNSKECPIYIHIHC